MPWCRKEKATLDLCCCGFKCNDAEVKHSHHPATQPAGTTGAAAGKDGVVTKPASKHVSLSCLAHCNAPA